MYVNHRSLNVSILGCVRIACRKTAVIVTGCVCGYWQIVPPAYVKRSRPMMSLFCTDVIKVLWLAFVVWVTPDFPGFSEIVNGDDA
ncbi:MAG: hypothetical protein V1751_01215 [Pseudomonadota bacterium]